jgi:hypothetical protein
VSTPPVLTPESPGWAGLAQLGDAYTCYSAALAAWASLEDPGWRGLVNTGLGLTLVEAEDGLFGFAHFPAGLRSRLHLRRQGSDDAFDGVAGILAELEASGRVIVAGDGFSQPWHVAAGRRHVPHWFVLAGSPSAPLLLDPFSCRNDLGLQEAELRQLDRAELEAVALAFPAGDAVVALREAFGLGDDSRPLEGRRVEWFIQVDEEVAAPAPVGMSGPAAVRRLARHFREHGEEADAYRQVDDIWSIARHRAFLALLAGEAAGQGDARISRWVDEHVAPLAKRWGHMAPLLMQATLALRAGRAPSGSVPATLDELGEREAAAAAACPAEVGELLLNPTSG